jgi:hypothetical protein
MLRVGGVSPKTSSGNRRLNAELALFDSGFLPFDSWVKPLPFNALICGSAKW